MFGLFSALVGKTIVILSMALGFAISVFLGQGTIVANNSTNPDSIRTATSSAIESDGGSVAITPSTTESKTETLTPQKTTATTTSSQTTTGANVSVAVPFVPPIVVPPIAPSFSSINASVRDAVVNIICTTENGGTLDPISGSGVVIDQSGVILTNAHVAEYLLLQNYLTPGYIDCVARTGSPARNTYTLELLYLSPQWIDANADTIVENDPTGTGEHDFAMFLITGRTDPSQKVTPPIPYLNPNVSDPSDNEGVLVAAYPAGFLGGISVVKDLYSASAVTTVQKIFTFDQTENTADLISVGGTVVAQKGSSGGAVVDGNGNLIGLIVTSTEAEATDDRDLRAITLGHINRDLKKYAGISLGALLNSDLPAFAAKFNATIAPTLTAKLEAALDK
jgi:hypothetical protein